MILSTWRLRPIPLQTALLLTHGSLLALPFILLLGTSALASDQAVEREKELSREAAMVAMLAESHLAARSGGGNAGGDPSINFSQLKPVLLDIFTRTGVGVRFVDSHGVVVASNGPRLGEHLGDRAEIQAALSGQSMAISRSSAPAAAAGRPLGEAAARGWSFAAAPVRLQNTVVGAVLTVHASRDSADLLGSVAERIGWWAGPLLISAFGMAIYAGYRLSRALHELANVADGIAQRGQTNVPVWSSITNTRVAEVRHVARAFEAMAQRLEARLQHNQGFAANVAHEFRTPLTTLRGTMDLLLDDPEMPIEQRQRFAENARVDLDRLARMVDGLLALAAAEGVVATEPVELAPLATRVLTQFADVGLTGLGGVVRGDAAQLELVLRNLVENALQHGDRPVFVELRASGFSVVDAGNGITPANLPHVFERFFTTSTERRGTGLGLAMVEAICAAHGGRVTIESRPGRTEFRVFLPTPDEQPCA